MFKKAILILVVLVSMMLTGCGNNNVESISDNEFLLDTVVSIRLYDVPEEKSELIDRSFDLIEELENQLSVHKDGSDLYNIKINAGIKPVSVSEHTIKVIQRSMDYAKITEGKFDITAGPLIDLWNIQPPTGHVPTQGELEAALTKIDYRKLVIDEDKQTVFLKEEGMIANLGAIAKGYIADVVKEFLLEEGIEHAIINLGGNVLLVGGRVDGTDFRIGVQDPDATRNTYLGVIKTSDASLVSSGDYERYFEQDGIRYHHILDPDTGYPSDTEIRQVSIVSPLSVDGDALSTTLFLLGLDQGLALIESMEGVDAVFVTHDHKVVVTEGLKDHFEFNDDEYSEIYDLEYR
ncbi:FAD:protein FMN transferase [Alkalibacter rhizosphaerae]|uniref:FAD:protein FMN transferase n=1 Tax=Alkalibacter rhizosphaerae TaxID=2815577 RepID=A0A975AIS0_9FIRM|nr:FAD:protein FMN transferase [Alkalibacter rhizosphaerae]QSX08964.1 FAD:protein FMN transferase [Alkalibacter rhizosphaerae]